MRVKSYIMVTTRKGRTVRGKGGGIRFVFANERFEEQLWDFYISSVKTST